MRIRMFRFFSLVVMPFVFWAVDYRLQFFKGWLAFHLFLLHKK